MEDLQSSIDISKNVDAPENIDRHENIVSSSLESIYICFNPTTLIYLSTMIPNRFVNLATTVLLFITLARANDWPTSGQPEGPYTTDIGVVTVTEVMTVTTTVTVDLSAQNTSQLCCQATARYKEEMTSSQI